MNYVANEVLKNYDYLAKKVRDYKPVVPKDKQVIEEGLRISKTVCAQEEYVHPTPIMKNIMILLGDVKQYQDETGEWHTEKFKADGKLGKGAEHIIQVLKAAMLRELGPEIRDYPEDLEFTDPKYYAVDCWLFYDQLPKKFWDIAPGQEEETAARFKTYENPVTNMSMEKMRNFIVKTPEMQKAIEIEQKIWPMTKASRDVTAISDPFMSKKTGVSYPDYRNDARIVPGTKMTYGEYEIDLTQRAAKKGDTALIKFGEDNAVNTGYTRRQMAKGRALIAMSRRTNLVINMINGVEMEHLKTTRGLNIPFLPEEKFLREFSKIGELLLKHKLVGVNIDASSWDQNLGEGIVLLQDAERYTLAQGNFSKKIVELRTKCNLKSYFVNGIADKVKLIFGRMTSGYDDTTPGNTKGNRTTATCSALKTSRNYVGNVIAKMQGYHVVAIGDDLFIVLEKYSDSQAFIKHETEDFGLVIHGDEKFAKGLFFIQWRIFKDHSKWVMAYNVPRVVRSMLSKEDAKHLGRGGWTTAEYQQLGKLMRYKPAFKVAVNILAAYDQYHLSIDEDVSTILSWVKQEDKEALANAKGKAVQTTAERMYKSNPNIQGLKVAKDGSIQLDGAYFRRVQKLMREVYDPDYLTKLGFSNPDLSKIH